MAVALQSRLVYAKSLTPLKGRAVGFLDSTITDDNGSLCTWIVFSMAIIPIQMPSQEILLT